MIAVDLVAAAKSGRPGRVRDPRCALDRQHRGDRRVPRRRQPELAREGRPRPPRAPPQADQGRGRRPAHRRLGRRRQGVRRHLHRDHGPRRRAPRRDRRAVPGAVRRAGGGMTPLDLVAASPDRAPLPIGAPAPGLRGPARHRRRAATASRTSPTATALVLIFSSNRCPTAKAYAERMNALQREYGPRGVQLLAINSNDPHLYPDESYAADGRAGGRGRLHVPVPRRQGPAGRAGVRRRRARSTSSCSTASAALRYQGRFDDSRLPASGHEPRPSERARRPPRRAGRSGSPTTRPFGCSLDFDAEVRTTRPPVADSRPLDGPRRVAAATGPRRSGADRGRLGDRCSSRR